MKKLKIVLGYLNIPRLLPHIFLYLRNPKLHQRDIERNMLFHDKSMFVNLVCLLVFNRYFRTLFYHRIGRVRHLIRFLCPDNKTLFFISPDTIIGEGMQCGHPFSTVVNAASIGGNFCVYQNVTIGAGGGGGKPMIMDNVSIFANSVVIGNITIGDNVKIGAGSVVTKTVPNDCVVVGNPAYIIRKNGEKVSIKL